MITAEVRHPTAAVHADQVFGAEPADRRLVGADERQVDAVDVAQQRDGGQAAATERDEGVGGRGEGGDGHHPGGPMLNQGTKNLRLELEPVDGVGDHDEEADLAEHLLHAERHLGHERVDHVRHDQPDQVVALGPQVGGGLVVDVPEPFGLGQHRDPRLLRHQGAVAHHQRHRGARDPERRRHVDHAHAARSGSLAHRPTLHHRSPKPPGEPAAGDDLVSPVPGTTRRPVVPGRGRSRAGSCPRSRRSHRPTRRRGTAAGRRRPRGRRRRT